MRVLGVHIESCTVFWWQAVVWRVCGGVTPRHPHFVGPMQGMLEFRLKEQAPVLALAAMCSPLDSGYCCVLGVVQLLCRFENTVPALGFGQGTTYVACCNWPG